MTRMASCIISTIADEDLVVYPRRRHQSSHVIDTPLVPVQRIMHTNQKYHEKAHKHGPNFMPKNPDVIPLLFSSFEVKGTLDPFKNTIPRLHKHRDVSCHPPYFGYRNDAYISAEIATAHQNPAAHFAKAIESAARGKQRTHPGIFDVQRLFCIAG